MPPRSTNSHLNGPKGRWLVGNLQSYEEDRLGFLTRLHRDFGGLAAFDSRTTVVSNPDLVDSVLRDAAGTFEVSQNFLGRHLSPDEVAAVLRVRPLLNPGLRPAAVASLGTLVRTLTIEAFGASQLGVPIDPTLPSERVISSVVAYHFFGNQGGSLVPYVASLLDALEKVIGNVFALPATWRSPAHIRIQRRYREVHRQVSELLLQRQRTPGLTDLASLVVQNGVGHSVEELANLLIGSLLAAQRVPAAAAGWLMMLVADHVQIQERLRVEANALHEFDAEAAVPVNRFPLAVASVLEALRLYPPTWLISRTATRRVVLGEHSFTAGHTFFVSPYVLHRDSALFDRPQAFDPDRWLGDSPPTRTYLPFGRGRHRCPGADLSVTILATMLLSLLKQQEIRRVGEVRADARASLRPVGLKLVFTKNEELHLATITDACPRSGTPGRPLLST